MLGIVKMMKSKKSNNLPKVSQLLKALDKIYSVEEPNLQTINQDIFSLEDVLRILTAVGFVIKTHRGQIIEFFEVIDQNCLIAYYESRFGNWSRIISPVAIQKEEFYMIGLDGKASPIM